MNLKFNLLLILFLKILLSIKSISTSPLSENKISYLNSTINLKVNSTLRFKNNTFDLNNQTLNLDNQTLNDQTKFNLVQPSGRTFQIFEFNSWLVGYIMKSFQSILGKTLIPDSSVIFLQTLVNPMYPFQYGSKLLNEIKESRLNSLESDENSQIAKNGEDDYDISDILIALKPKVIDGLSELADLGVLQQLHPIINLTVENYDDSTSSDQLSNTKTDGSLNNSVVYDLIDFNKYKKIDKSHIYNEQYGLNMTTIADLLVKRKINKTSTINLDNEITTIQSINELNTETIQNIKQLNETTIEFRKLEHSDQQIDTKKTDYELIKQDDELNKTIENELIISLDQLNNQTTINNQTKIEKLNQLDNNEKLNKTEYSIDKPIDDIDKPILTLFSCDGDKCTEENLEGQYLDNDHKPINSTTKIQKPSSPNEVKPGNLKSDIKKLASLLKEGLIIRPAYWIKDRLIRLKSIIKRDIRILYKMAQSFIGFTSSTCRYKFICLFSSFFSLHTPDFVKSNMPTQVEDYYIKIMEVANRNQFLNAIVTGYIFDCEEFYTDPKCP